MICSIILSFNTILNILIVFANASRIKSHGERWDSRFSDASRSKCDERRKDLGDEFTGSQSLITPDIVRPKFLKTPTSATPGSSPSEFYSPLRRN